MSARARTWGFVAGGLLVAVALAFGASRVASSAPDGLEKVAADHGLTAEGQPRVSPDGRPAASGISEQTDQGIDTGVAGLIGVAAAFGTAGGAGRLRSRRRDRGSATGETERAATGSRPGPDQPAEHRPEHRPEHGSGARIDPATGIVCALVFVVAVVLTPREAVWAFAVYAAAVALAAGFARVPIGVLTRRMIVEIPFVLFALALPFIGSGPRRELWGIPVSVEGSWAAWGILAKATIGVVCSIVLAWSVPPAALLGGLERLRCPRILVMIAGFMIRYLDTVSGELSRLQVARISRGDDPHWLWQARAAASTAGALFVRTFERGERIQQSMLARGFTGSFPATAGATRGPGSSKTSILPVVLIPLTAVGASLAANLVTP